MEDKLFTTCNRFGIGHRIQWYIAELDDTGAILGEDIHVMSLKRMAKWLNKAEAKTDAGTAEHYIATIAVSTSTGVANDETGYFWENATQAKQALRLANAAIKSWKSKKPWPKWAQEAKANGWTPPKKWKP